jgi:hypothetical protein
MTLPSPSRIAAPTATALATFMLSAAGSALRGHVPSAVPQGSQRCTAA